MATGPYGKASTIHVDKTSFDELKTPATKQINFGKDGFLWVLGQQDRSGKFVWMLKELQKTLQRKKVFYKGRGRANLPFAQVDLRCIIPSN